MRDRASVRQADNGQWRATRPRYGLGQPETKLCPSRTAAFSWLTACAGHGGTVHTELSWQRCDGVSSAPGWEALERDWPVDVTTVDGHDQPD